MSLQFAAQLAWIADDPSIGEEATRLAVQQGFGERWTSICRANAALATGEWRAAIEALETHLAEHFGRMLCCEHAELAYARTKVGDADAALSNLRTAAEENPDCNTLHVLEQLGLMPVRELLPTEIRPWLLSEQPLG